MNILIASTQQWNPGDEFIRMGVINLLRDVLPGDHNWILYNRNPDLFLGGFSNPRLKTNTWSNSFSEPNLDVIDLVILAGSPEWTGPPLEKIYKALLDKPEIPLWAIGVGYSFPGLELSENEKTILSRKSTKILCRSYEVSDQVNEQLGMERAITLPCPAMFCGGARLLPPKPLGVILQGCEGKQEISRSLRDKLLSNPGAERITFYKDEFLELERLGYDSYYHFDARALLDHVSRFEKVISSRLHGAIAALSHGIPTYLAADPSNYRILTAQKPFGEFLPIWGEEVELKKPHEILAFKDGLKQQYLEALK